MINHEPQIQSRDDFRAEMPSYSLDPAQEIQTFETRPHSEPHSEATQFSPN